MSRAEAPKRVLPPSAAGGGGVFALVRSRASIRLAAWSLEPASCLPASSLPACLPACHAVYRVSSPSGSCSGCLWLGARAGRPAQPRTVLAAADGHKSTILMTSRCQAMRYTLQTMATKSGRCLCGKIRYELKGTTAEPLYNTSRYLGTDEECMLSSFMLTFRAQFATASTVAARPELHS